MTQTASFPSVGSSVILNKPLTNGCGHTFARGYAMIVKAHWRNPGRLLLIPADKADRRSDQHCLAAEPKDVEEIA